MKYPTEAEIKKLKQKELSGRAGWRIGAVICLLCLVATVLVMWSTQPAPLAYVPVTAIFPSRTDAPTPTLAATATPSPTGTAVATGTTTMSSQLAQALATYTPAPTYTPLPTYTPRPTQTAAPTQTPLPTYTPAATYTPRPTPVIIVTYQTAVSDLTQARASLVWGLLSSFSLMLLSAAPLVYAWRHRPAAPVIVEGVPISETAVRLPPPTWQPVRERTVQRPEPSSEPVQPVQPSSELPEPPQEMALPLVGRGDTPPTAMQRAYIRRRFAETNNKTAVAMEVFNSKGGTIWFFINWALLEGQVRHLLGQEEARAILERGVS